MFDYFKFTRRLLILLIIFLSLFDPFGKIFGAKYFVFVALALASLPTINFQLKNYKNARHLFIFFIVFSLVIPLYGLLIGLIYNSEFLIKGWAGYFYACLYLFLSLCILDEINYTNKILILGLNILSLIIIGLFFIGKYIDFSVLNEFGLKYEVFIYGKRTYGPMDFSTVYYFTSPLLVMSLAYWSYSITRKIKPVNGLMFVLTALALFLSGTRNNMIAAVFVPIASFGLFGKSRWNFLILIFAALSTAYIDYFAVFAKMFDTADISNTVKLGYIEDYLGAAQNLHSLIFGQGLGAFFYASPLDAQVNVTELTYLEILRMYGLFVGALVIAMIFFPLSRLLINKNLPNAYIFIGYAFYLLISMLNPYIFSSNGMLIISVALVNYFMMSKKSINIKPVKLATTVSARS